MKIEKRLSPNFGDRENGGHIDKIILHYTGMKNTKQSLERMCSPNSAVSAHYLIGEYGGIYQIVKEKNRAWHAGESYWAGQNDINSHSIGIEIQNPGHEWGYKKFSQKQMNSVVSIAKDIIQRRNIPNRNVLGHSDISPGRKQDPGMLFNWQWLSENGVGFWPKVGNLRETKFPKTFELRAQLNSIGYDPSISVRLVLLAFQRHYRPKKIDGLLDSETASLIHCFTKTS
ncbi:MAG: N-acetylmuramoyl-L-alanine amidase [Pseudomonadota bacterium]|nr:N-acetylmuramoyl-L-alanine amidase [Pseudomonadota bacterium]